MLRTAALQPARGDRSGDADEAVKIVLLVAQIGGLVTVGRSAGRTQGRAVQAADSADCWLSRVRGLVVQHERRQAAAGHPSVPGRECDAAAVGPGARTAQPRSEGRPLV